MDVKFCLRSCLNSNDFFLWVINLADVFISGTQSGACPCTKITGKVQIALLCYCKRHVIYFRHFIIMQSSATLKGTRMHMRLHSAVLCIKWYRSSVNVYIKHQNLTWSFSNVYLSSFSETVPTLASHSRSWRETRSGVLLSQPIHLKAQHVVRGKMLFCSPQS